MEAAAIDDRIATVWKRTRDGSSWRRHRIS
jgi:hypothetical protein